MRLLPLIRNIAARFKLQHERYKTDIRKSLLKVQRGVMEYIVYKVCRISYTEAF